MGVLYAGAGRYEDPGTGTSLGGSLQTLFLGDTNPLRDAGNNPVTWPADATWGEWFSATWTASVGGYLSGLYKMATQSSWGEIGWSALNLASSVVVNAVDPFGVGRILVGMASGGTTIAGGEGRAGTVLDEIAQDLTDAQAGMADGLTMGIGSSLRELSGVHYADNSSPLYLMGNIAGQITSAVAMSFLTGGAGAAAVAARAIGRFTAAHSIARNVFPSTPLPPFSYRKS